MTSTGHVACSAQLALTDPRSMPENPPWPRLPTMSMVGSFALVQEDLGREALSNQQP